MTRILAIAFIALALAACGQDSSTDATDSTGPAPAATEQDAQPTQAPPAESIDDEESIKIAQEMDETAPSDSEDTAEDDSVVLAETPPAEAATPDPISSRFRAGQHYRVLTPVQPTSVAPGKVEVAEIFWYGCPHCYTLEPYLTEWLADGIAPNAELVRIPAALNRGWQAHARVFYAAEALGVLDDVNEDLFREIHVNGNPLNTEESLIAFFEGHGVSEKDFLEAFNSFAVQTKLRQSDSRVRRYRLSGVPAIVVNGKYVTGAEMAGSYEELFELIDYLIARESR